MKKRMIAFLITCAIVLNMFSVSCTTLYAADADTYVSEHISAYIYAGNISDAKYLSDSFYVTDLNGSVSNHYAYFVLSDDNILALLYVTENDDGYSSSFMSVSLDSDLIGKCIAVFQTSDSIYIRCNGSDILLYGTQNQTIDINAASLSYSTLEASHELSLSPQSRGTTYYNLDVPYVRNDCDPNGYGLCWAAASASKINYTLGYSYSAMTVYNMCNSATTANRPSGSPNGTIQWVKFGFYKWLLFRSCR